MIDKSAAREIENIRFSPQVVVVTRKNRIISDRLFDVQSREKKGGLNRLIEPDTLPQFLRAEALSTFLDELVTLRKIFPEQRILTSKANVSDACPNVRLDPNKCHNFCYNVGGLVVIGFRLTFGWLGSKGFWGIISAAAAHAHCNTTIHSAQLLDERK